MSDRQILIDNNLKTKIAILSVIGDREDQQDSYAYSLNTMDGIVIVCDGMGGILGGKLASTTAANIIASIYSQNSQSKDITSLLISAFKNADKVISQFKDENGQQMRSGSTAVAVVIKNDELNWCSVGDSRAYLLRNGEFIQFTQDQNYKAVINEQRNTKAISQQEYEKVSYRGDELISYLGIGNLKLIDYNVSPIKLKQNDRVAIMSDGLYRLVSNIEIKEILNNCADVSDAIKLLEAKAVRNSKLTAVNRDNMTIALIEIK